MGRRLVGTRGGRRLGARSGRRPAQREAGYNLVMLMVMVTLLNILVAKTLPLWSGVIQREKEAELIFRGMQYAEAIRIYEARTGALPTKLEQLIEIKPRCIRQLWKNPIAEDGAWQLIPAGQGRRVAGGNQNQNQNQQRLDQGRDLPGNPSRPDQSLLWIPGGESKIGAVAISGVKSSVGGQSIKIFVTNPNAPGGGGSNEISEWQFTHELAKSLIMKPDPAKPIVPSMNVASRFKPFPPNVTPLNVPQGAGAHAVENPGRPNSPVGGTPERKNS